MKTWMKHTLTALIVASSFGAGLVGCGDEKSNNNNPYGYGGYGYGGYGTGVYGGYGPVGPYGQPAYNPNAVRFSGQIYITGDFEGFLKRSNLCGKLFVYWTTFTGPGSFGPSNCGHVNQNPIALVSINDYKFPNNGTSTGSIVLAASHAAYGTQGLPATFRKIDENRFEAITSS